MGLGETRAQKVWTTAMATDGRLSQAQEQRAVKGLTDGGATPADTWLPVARHASWGFAQCANVFKVTVLECRFLGVMAGPADCDPRSSVSIGA